MSDQFWQVVMAIYFIWIAGMLLALFLLLSRRPASDFVAFMAVFFSVVIGLGVICFTAATTEVWL